MVDALIKTNDRVFDTYCGVTSLEIFLPLSMTAPYECVIANNQAWRNAG